jgi:hypothetical protein
LHSAGNEAPYEVAGECRARARIKNSRLKREGLEAVLGVGVGEKLVEIPA